jgi:hypothetical protein
MHLTIKLSSFKFVFDHFSSPMATGNKNNTKKMPVVQERFRSFLLSPPPLNLDLTSGKRKRFAKAQ